MTQQELTNKVNEAITLWASGRTGKLVIAIDGYAGVGKTTLLNNLVKLNPDIIAVNRDDFMFSRKVVQEKLASVEDKSMIWELEACDNKKLEDFIIAFRNKDILYKIDAHDNEGTSGEVNIPKTFDFSKKIMVVEGVFMFHPKLPLNKLWDKRIYLEGNIITIKERRVKREKIRWGKNYFPETHPDSYFRQVIVALERYIGLCHPEKIADLVLKVD